MPRPRNDSAASARIANASDSEVCTMIGAAAFGSTCMPMIRRSLAPIDVAAVTYSSSRTLSTLARVTRAKIGA